MTGLDRVWDQRGQCWEEAGPREKGEASLESMVVTSKERGEFKGTKQEIRILAYPSLTSTKKMYHLLKKMYFIHPCN